MPSEFEFIRNIKKKYGLNYVGDDCAVLPKDARTDLVVTTDMLVEGVDFRLDWTSPEFLGHKALAVSLSDVAAMGGIPKWALLSLAIPASVWAGKFLDRLLEGWHTLATENKVELVGGDISKTSGKLVIDSIVFGDVTKGRAILRSGARPGDSVFVTGPLGGASGGLQLLKVGATYSRARGARKQLIARQLRPTPRLDASEALAARKLATSMIDISDGFSSDLAHVCRSSNVGAVITDLPVDRNLYRSFSETDALQRSLHGGEDFELLFTVDPADVKALDDLSFTHVGVITEKANEIRFVYRGKDILLKPHGFRHF